jgi:hypothetical protein
MRGDEIIRAWCVSYGVSRSLDTEIPPPYPESWGGEIYKQTFSKDNEKDAWV